MKRTADYFANRPTSVERKQSPTSRPHGDLSALPCVGWSTKNLGDGRHPCPSGGVPGCQRAHRRSPRKWTLSSARSSPMLGIVVILKARPRFDQDFKIPEKAGDPERWLIGRAAFWPDVARQTPFDRPKWHYQRGASLVLKSVASEAPPIPYPQPPAEMNAACVPYR